MTDPTPEAPAVPRHVVERLAGGADFVSVDGHIYRLDAVREVAEGWQLVPKKPTPDMLAAGTSAYDTARAIYEAMLRAAPSVPPAPPASRLEAPPVAQPDWVPTAATINALPEPIRRYVHDLATRCDPAGDVAQIALLKDQVRQLEASNRTLRDAAPPVAPAAAAERMFPILRGVPVKSIPWRLLEPNEDRAKRNHYQTLEQLARRGGLSAAEAVAVLEDKPFSEIAADVAAERLLAILARAALSAGQQDARDAAPVAIAWRYPDGRPCTLTWAGDDEARMRVSAVKYNLTRTPLVAAMQGETPT